MSWNWKVHGAAGSVIFLLFTYNLQSISPLLVLPQNLESKAESYTRTPRQGVELLCFCLTHVGGKLYNFRQATTRNSSHRDPSQVPIFTILLDDEQRTGLMIVVDDWMAGLSITNECAVTTTWCGGRRWRWRGDLLIIHPSYSPQTSRKFPSLIRRFR